MLTFFSIPLNPKRSTPALSSASISKLKQEVLVFLQYLYKEKDMPSPRLISCFKVNLIKDFVEYLLHAIGMGHSSIRNYMTALKNAIIYQAAKSRRCATKVLETGILRKISNLSNQLEVGWLKHHLSYEFDTQDISQWNKHGCYIPLNAILLMYATVLPAYKCTCKPRNRNRSIPQESLAFQISFKGMM